MNASPSVLRLGPFSLLWRPRSAAFCCALIMLGLVLAIALLNTGALVFSPMEIAATFLGASDNPIANRIILQIRLPRVATAMFVGASLGMAGSIFQSISRNALGSPDIIGFTTGAATGAIVQIILFDAGPLAIALAAAFSGIATAATVFLLSLKGRVSGSYRFVLVGIGVGAMLSGVNVVLLVTSDLDRAMSAQLWLAGSLAARDWSHVASAGVGFAITAPIALYHARRIDLLEMGDDAASQLGVSTERTRLVLIIVAVNLTAIATAAAGPIAFIALAAPQLARRSTRSPGAPLISSAAMGAVLLLAADLLSQRFPFQVNIPIGLSTSLLGGFYLLWLLTRKRRI